MNANQPELETIRAELALVSRECDRLRLETRDAKTALAQLQTERNAEIEVLVARRTEVLETREVGLKQLVDQLRREDALKDQFLTIVSHELRTPINAITGFGSILEDGLAGPLTDQQQTYVRRMLQGADVLLSLIEDLLDMGRIAAGKFSISPRLGDMGKVARTVFENMTQLAEQKGHHLELKVPADLPKVQLDGQRIGQVLTNLVGNAIKYTPHGTVISVEIKLEAGHLKTQVADNGKGISPQDFPRLFQPFSQLEAGNTRSGTGTGLGLAIAKALVEAHGGNIGVESDMERGSTFWFDLPLPAQPGGQPSGGV